MKLLKKKVVEMPVQVTSEKPVEVKEKVEVYDTTLERLFKKAEDIQSVCGDYTVEKVSPQNFRFNEDGRISFLCDGVNTFPMSQLAMSQLGTKIGVPASYLQKCIDSGRCALAADNVNSWVEGYDKDLFIRECNGHVRGILSSKYAVCDTQDIIKCLEDVVDLSKYKVKGHVLNEERFHLRLVGKEMLPIDGEDLFPGLFINSSDVGRSVLTVQFGVYKQVCTNGLIVSAGGGTLFEQKHIGIRIEDFHDGLLKQLSLVDKLCENAVMLVEQCRNKDNKYHVSASMSEEDFNTFVAQIQGQTKLSKDSAVKVIDLMRTKYGDNKWGLINSITEVAQDFTLERRIELERIAGHLLAA